MNKDINFDAKEFRVLSEGCLDVLKQMLEFDPNFRLSAMEALEHQYFTQTENFNQG